MRIFRALFQLVARTLAIGLPEDETVCWRCFARIRITEKGVTAAHFPRHRKPPAWKETRDEVKSPAGTVAEAEVMRRLRRHWCSGSGRAP